MELERAIEVFTQGFSYTRSFTHPYLVSRKHGLTIMQDGPGKKGHQRRPEYIVYGMSPKKAHTALKKSGFVRGGACVVCENADDLDEVKRDYKALGLRLLFSEPFFSADPSRVPKYKAPVRIERVVDAKDADKVNRAAGRRQILPEHLGRDDKLRLYAAFNGGSCVGYVKSIPVGEDAWVSNLFVDASARGKGIGRSLMSLMLQDDAAHGVNNSVLLASGAGSRLYPHLGYERIGTLLFFAPGPGWKA